MQALDPCANLSSAAFRSSSETEEWWTKTSTSRPRIRSATVSVNREDHVEVVVIDEAGNLTLSLGLNDSEFPNGCLRAAAAAGWSDWLT